MIIVGCCECIVYCLFFIFCTGCVFICCFCLCVWCYFYNTTRIVFKKDNQKCGVILQHELKNSSAYFRSPLWLFLLDGGTYVKFD